MKYLRRFIGGMIFAFSFILLIVPYVEREIALGILGLFLGMYILIDPENLFSKNTTVNSKI